MELRHLRTAVVLAEELHFGRAAARLHVVQPAVSQTLKQLEDELGTSLFARTQRRVRLTAAGEVFVAHARRSLAALSDGTRAAQRTADGTSGVLTLGFTIMAALTVVPSVIARFRREVPGVTVQVRSRDSSEQVEEIRKGRLDIGFLSYTDAARPLARHTVSDEPLMTLLPVGHRLAKRRSVRLRELAGEPVVAFSRAAEPVAHGLYLRACREAGFDPDIVLEINQIDALLAFVAAGLGISHAPASIRRLSHPGVAVVPIAPRMPSGITAVWDDEAISPAGRRFLAMVRQATAGRAELGG